MTSGPVSDVLARATAREVLQPADARAGAAYERVIADGRSYFLKRLSPAGDWIMRATGDHVHRPYLVWRAGVMDKAPASIDHTVVAMEVAGTGDDAVLSMLMRDVSACLVPPGDDQVPRAQHEGFVTHMAEMAAAFWGWEDDLGLTAMAERLRFFAPGNIAGELTVAHVPAPVAAAAEGWRLLPERSPALWELARLAHERPAVLTGPLSQTPRTFVHGDWKMGNLGSHPDGRTILLDWSFPGAGPACWDLCWYLALNRARLPEPKETAIGRFRAALQACGVNTDPWWERQLDLCMIGIMATFGWEKALGDSAELAWWQERATVAAARCGIGPSR